RRARAHDRREPGWTQRRDLQRVEPSPREPAQPDLAVAPRLRGEPLDGVGAVSQLGREVLVVQQAVRVAAARDRDAHVRDARPRERATVRRVREPREPLVRIRVVAEDRTDRRVAVGPPRAGVQSPSIGQWDPAGVLSHATMVPWPTPATGWSRPITR